MTKMNIGIIGSGNIGRNPGIYLAGAGYEVMFSSRHPDELKALAEKPETAPQRALSKKQALLTML
ncbi:MAG TPA: NAD(P)-binding domain-containing protein [Fodinibius sp.]|nr:NAD(P)-binding domain-containing protein [Fodinibius sp.]